MVTITNYTFISGGFFLEQTVSQPNAPPNLTVGINFPGPQLVTAVRPNGEIPFDLGKNLDVNSILGVAKKLIDGVSGVTITSGIQIGWTPWASVPYFLQNVVAHNFKDVLIRLAVNGKYDMPWPIGDADFNISYYIFPSLVNHKLKVSVDGQWVHVDGGWPLTSLVSEGLGLTVNALAAEVQKAINTALKSVPALPTSFSHVYVLPGNGSTAAIGTGDSSLDATIAIAP
jgi:hypothetical protein